MLPKKSVKQGWKIGLKNQSFSGFLENLKILRRTIFRLFLVCCEIYYISVSHILITIFKL